MFLLYALILLLVLGSSARAQLPAYRNYTVKDGLPSSEVYDVFQDSQGYIWFATNAGVSRFDGYRFRNFSTLNGLADNTIFEIYEDYRRRLWFRSRTGRLSYFFHDSIYSISANEQIAANVQGPYILNSIYVDKGDTIWLGYNGGKFFKVYNFHAAHPGFEQIANRNATLRRASDGGEIIWSPGMARPAHFLPLLINNRPEPVPLIKPIRNDSKIVRIANRPDEWIASVANEVYHFSTGGMVARATLPTRIIALSSDSTGNLWVGTYGKGALCFPNSDITQKPTTYFPESFVTDVYQDHEKGYWFATLLEGVLYAPCRDICTYISGTRSAERVTCITSDGRGNVLAGLYSGKISLFNSETEHSAPLPLW